MSLFRGIGDSIFSLLVTHDSLPLLADSRESRDKSFRATALHYFMIRHSVIRPLQSSGWLAGRLDVRLWLARVDWDHFGPDARTAYNAGHHAALDIALKGGDDHLELAYAMNAFADHFLQDSFAAGHLRTPRRALHKRIDFSANLYTKYMHDEDNGIGLNIITRKGKHFKFFGDKRLLSPDNVQKLAECKLALEASSAEIYNA
ncbi:hypothetical protein BDR22DRAFT_825722 [Usnea florida]